MRLRRSSSERLDRNIHPVDHIFEYGTEHVFVKPAVPTTIDLPPKNDPFGFRKGEFMEESKFYKKKFDRYAEDKIKFYSILSV
jgi:hypothetical protein